MLRMIHASMEDLTQLKNSRELVTTFFLLLLNVEDIAVILLVG